MPLTPTQIQLLQQQRPSSSASAVNASAAAAVVATGSPRVPPSAVAAAAAGQVLLQEHLAVANLSGSDVGNSPNISPSNVLNDMWVSEESPGVFLWLRPHASGKQELVKIRFARNIFTYPGVWGWGVDGDVTYVRRLREKRWAREARLVWIVKVWILREAQGILFYLMLNMEYIIAEENMENIKKQMRTWRI